MLTPSSGPISGRTAVFHGPCPQRSADRHMRVGHSDRARTAGAVDGAVITRGCLGSDLGDLKIHAAPRTAMGTGPLPLPGGCHVADVGPGPPARAMRPSHSRLGFGVRSKVSRSTAMRPNVGSQ